MYCGDETGSFIGDVGAHVSRFGFGGDDTPKCNLQSLLQGDDPRPLSSCLRYHGSVRTPLRMVEGGQQPVVDPTKYLQQGDKIEDWNAYEALWQSAFDQLKVLQPYKHTKGFVLDTSDTREKKSDRSASATVKSNKGEGEGGCEHPLLAVSSGCTHRVGDNTDPQKAHRKELEKFSELMFEKFDAKAVFVAPQPMLAAFSHGRQTCLLVDMAASGTRVTPVVDGLLLKQSQRRSGRGAQWLQDVCWKALQDSKTLVRPRYQLRQAPDKAAPGIFHRWATQDIMYELLTSEHVRLPHWRFDPTMPFVNVQKERNVGTAENTYELPDGTLIDLTTPVGQDLCRAPDLLFTEQVPFCDGGVDDSILSQATTFSNQPLEKLIHESLSSVNDVDMRRDLAGNIVVTGGLSTMNNLEKRLSLEVSRALAGAYKPKVTASKFTVERRCASWIGGSILTSLGSFQQLWLSKQEYEEYGATLAVQRFP